MVDFVEFQQHGYDDRPVAISRQQVVAIAPYGNGGEITSIITSAVDEDGPRAFAVKGSFATVLNKLR